MTRLWIVRAGAQGERELAAIDQGRLLPGFLTAGDLTGLRDREAILAHLREVMPDEGKNRLRNYSAQLNQFVNTMRVGDMVVMPRKVTNGVAIGVVAGDYAFDPARGVKHSRPVQWRAESLPRDTFKQDLRHSFGAFLSVCEIKRNAALDRVKAVLETGLDPGPLLGKQGQVPKAPVTGNGESEETEPDDYQTDIEDLANQQIVSLIKTEFAGHALADLVAEILRVEGYTTKVSPPGPDGGVDILAAGGTLGLGEDRICVQVKSGDGAVNREVIATLGNALRITNAQTGLLVSIGGVTAAAQKDLDADFFRLRLWQMPDLLRALFRTYGELSDETRAKLPLKQIWAPVTGSAS
jgi:restriction system protein